SGDDAEFEGTAATLALAYRVVRKKLGQPPAVFVRAAMDHDEAVRRRTRPDRLRFPAVSPAHCGARPASSIGHADGRAVHDTKHRAPLLDECYQHRELAVAGDKFAGPVERVDRPETVTAGRYPLSLAQFLGDTGDVGKGRHQPLDDDPLGCEIGFG